MRPSCSACGKSGTSRLSRRVSPPACLPPQPPPLPRVLCPLWLLTGVVACVRAAAAFPRLPAPAARAAGCGGAQRLLEENRQQQDTIESLVGRLDRLDELIQRMQVERDQRSLWGSLFGPRGLSAAGGGAAG